MAENHTELSQRLVVGDKQDGRRCYDKAAKRELIEACLRPGVSVARMALQHGLNANLLRTWIRRYQCPREGMVGPSVAALPTVTVASAFVPVVAAKAPTRSGPVRFGAQLPNGIKLELSEVDSSALSLILRLLCELPCSGSTPG